MAEVEGGVTGWVLEAEIASSFVSSRSDLI